MRPRTPGIRSSSHEARAFRTAGSSPSGGHPAIPPFSRPRRAGAMHLPKATGICRQHPVARPGDAALSDHAGVPAQRPLPTSSGRRFAARVIPRPHRQARARITPCEIGLASSQAPKRPLAPAIRVLRPEPGRSRMFPGLSTIAVQEDRVRRLPGLARDPARRSAALQQRKSAQAVILRDAGKLPRISNPCQEPVGSQKAPDVRAAPAEPDARRFPCQPRLPRVP